jgi:hypothetical protein
MVADADNLEPKWLLMLLLPLAASATATAPHSCKHVHRASLTVLSVVLGQGLALQIWLETCF